MTLFEMLVEALSQLPQPAHIDAIKERVKEIAAAQGIERKTFSVRTVLSQNKDVFKNVNPGSGMWALAAGGPLPDVWDEGLNDLGEPEGKRVLVAHLRAERSRKLVAAFKARLPNFKCTACSFDFEVRYGELGAGFIEAHHIEPVSKLKGDKAPDLNQLAALCSNCHRMIHKAGLISVEELKRRMQL
ncbi:HNH endonuclease [Bosea robiniae]|uniref:HNH endonuclease n=1 Tax=Bosea robiniae TaxID=1036780 RepID=A0ABY0NIM2_9HYPH|nr:HNH endonuclease [Bosea robiniae]SDF36974.1 HNH endonuclease [Bosea robiniae]